MGGKDALVIEHAERLAKAFFRIDPSSRRPDGIDLRLGLTDPIMIRASQARLPSEDG